MVFLKRATEWIDHVGVTAPLSGAWIPSLSGVDPLTWIYIGLGFLITLYAAGFLRKYGDQWVEQRAPLLLLAGLPVILLGLMWPKPQIGGLYLLVGALPVGGLLLNRLWPIFSGIAATVLAIIMWPIGLLLSVFQLIRQPGILPGSISRSGEPGDVKAFAVIAQNRSAADSERRSALRAIRRISPPPPEIDEILPGILRDESASSTLHFEAILAGLTYGKNALSRWYENYFHWIKVWNSTTTDIGLSVQDAAALSDANELVKKIKRFGIEVHLYKGNGDSLVPSGMPNDTRQLTREEFEQQYPDSPQIVLGSKNLLGTAVHVQWGKSGLASGGDGTSQRELDGLLTSKNIADFLITSVVTEYIRETKSSRMLGKSKTLVASTVAGAFLVMAGLLAYVLLHLHGGSDMSPDMGKGLSLAGFTGVFVNPRLLTKLRFQSDAESNTSAGAILFGIIHGLIWRAIGWSLFLGSAFAATVLMSGLLYPQLDKDSEAARLLQPQLPRISA